MMKSQGLF